MNPCLRCGKRREHAFHDPRARVYREDRHEYVEDGIECGICGEHVPWRDSAVLYLDDVAWGDTCKPCMEEAVLAW